MILMGKKVQEELLEELKKISLKCKRKPCALVIITNKKTENIIYYKEKEKIAKKLGCEIKYLNLEEKEEKEIIKIINDANKDKNIDGIFLELPLNNKLDFDKIRNKINYKKDLDGINDKNIGKIVSKKKGMVPCTALGVIKLLEYYKINLEQKNVVIIGRNINIGKALGNILINKNATVTICHSKTKNLEKITKKADIVITAVGKRNLITKKMIKKGSIVVDIAFGKDEKGIYGDVDYEKVKNKCSYITPVPLGVGPMTVYAFFSNLIDAYLINNKV